MQQQQQQQLFQCLASVTNHPTSIAESSIQQSMQQQPHQQLYKLNEVRIQQAIQQAVNPLSSGSFDGSTCNLIVAPQPLYSKPADSSAILTASSISSNANTVSSTYGNGTISDSIGSSSSGVTNLLQSLACQTAQMQSVINVLMAQQQQQQQQQQASISASLANDSEHTLLPAMSSASISSMGSTASDVSSTSVSSMVPCSVFKPELVPATPSLITNLSASSTVITAVATATVSSMPTSNSSSTLSSVPTSPSPSGSLSPTDAVLTRSRASTISPTVGVSLQASGLPAQVGPYSLAIVAQPELNHRARYLTEGSRGSVKDRLHQGYPTVQLSGWLEPVQLCIFVAADSNTLRPHSHYQACRVAGKTAASRAVELDCEDSRVLVVNWDPRENSLFSIDCIGILKLRNVDICPLAAASQGRGQKRGYQQQQQQQQQRKCGSGVNTQARLVFQVCLGANTTGSAGESTVDCVGDGGSNGPVILQAVSDTIVCSQPVGSPEVLRVSSTEGPCQGGSDLFLIGKNFARGSRVIFRESRGKSNNWEAEAVIEADHFTQAHLICRVPAYRRTDLSAPITVQVTVRCDDRRDSEPFYYTYKPAAVPLRMATPAELLN